MMKTYYITGVSGFLGFNIVKALQKQDCKIVGLILPNDRNAGIFKELKNVTLIEGNILNSDDIKSFLTTNNTEENYLIHCAGKITTLKNGDDSIIKINFGGTKTIVDVYKTLNFNKFVYVSSVDALDEIPGNTPIVEQKEFHPENASSIYAKSKNLSNNYIMENLSDYVIVMPSAIFGPDDPLNSPINNAIKKVITKNMPGYIHGKYNLVDVRDVASAIINCCNLDVKKQTYILGGEVITIKDLFDTVTSLNGIGKIWFPIPRFLIQIISPFIELNFKITRKTPLFTGYSMHCLTRNCNFDCTKAKKEIGFTNHPISQSISDTCEFLKSKI